MALQSTQRSARSVLFAAVCVGLATAGHSAVAQEGISLWVAGAGFTGVLLITRMLAGVERSMATILGCLLGAQYALHSLFTATARHAAHTAAACAPGAGTHAHHTPHLLAGTHTPHRLTMTAAHVAAAVIAAWWLRRGERAVWGLARRVAAVAAARLRTLFSLLSPGSPAYGSRPGTAGRHEPVWPGGSALRHTMAGRAPPAVSTAPARPGRSLGRALGSSLGFPYGSSSGCSYVRSLGGALAG